MDHFSLNENKETIVKMQLTNEFSILWKLENTCRHLVLNNYGYFKMKLNKRYWNALENKEHYVQIVHYANVFANTYLCKMLFC